MAEYSIRLDTVHLLSTANPYPYWDQLVVAISVDRIGTVDGERRVIESVGYRVGYVGDIEQGGARALNTVQPQGGSGWEIEIPEPAPGEEMQLSVVIHNVRGLPEQEIFRLLGKFAIFGGEITADELIHFTSKALEVVKVISLGIAGFLLEHLVEELFPDPPKCMGLVMKESMSCSPVILAERTYTKHSGFVGDGNRYFNEVQEWLVGDIEASPQNNCGRPSARVQYTIRETTQLSFGSAVNFNYSYTELDALHINDIYGSWVDINSASVPLPRVMVTINRSNIPLKDSVDVSVIERLIGQGNSVTTIADHLYSDLHLEWMLRLLPGEDIFGTLQRIILPKKKRGVSLASAAKAVEMSSIPDDQAKEDSEKIAPSKSPHLADESTANVSDLADLQNVPLAFHNVSLLSEIRHLGLHLYPIELLMRNTACLPLPNGSILSFWAVFIKVNGKQTATRGIAVRYSRGDSLIATRTDCWLMPWALVK
jgi:hypothetical protein